MQAILLAAGKSSRFYPFRRIHHKSLFPVMDRPFIEYTVKSIKHAGIKDIIIVVQKEDEFLQVLGNGEKYGVRIQYVLQSEPKGMGNAVLQAKSKIHSDFFVLSAHRADFADYANQMIKMKTGGRDAVLLAKETNNIEQFGKVTLQGDKVVSIEEKPIGQTGEKAFRLLSSYLFSPTFLDILAETPEKEYQFEDALSSICQSANVGAYIVPDEAFSLKFPWDALDIGAYLLKKTKRHISPNATIAKSAEIIGDVVIEDGVRIMEYAVVKGPSYIGKNVVVGNHTLVRDNTILEKNVVIGAHSEVRGSILQDGTHLHSGFIGDSVIGYDNRLGAATCVSNKRLDREIIKTIIRKQTVSTRRTNLGLIMGDRCNAGIQVGYMPGVVIGSNVVIGPSTTVMNNIADDTLFYTKFSTVKRQKTNE